MEGRVLWFKSTYGFLRPNDSNDEIFFHWADIKSSEHFKQVYSGDRVAFDVVEEPRFKDSPRLKAINVKSLERVSGLGKRLLRLSYIEREDNVNINYVNCYITAKANMGLKFINITNEKIIATDLTLTRSELETLSEILKLHQLSSKIFYTGDSFKYDLNLV